MSVHSKGYRNCAELPKAPQNIPPMQIITDLPCPADEDLDEIPAPRYTPDDIVKVQHILLNFVPTELADVILDMAEYWPYVGISRNSFASAYSAIEAPDGDAQWCYLVTPRVPAVERAGVALPTSVRKVRFMVKAYTSSWGASNALATKEKTWFEAAILKKDEDVAPSYVDGLRPNDWFANLAQHPRYLMENFRDTQYPGMPVDNPLDSKQHWHVMETPLTGSKDTPWHEVVWGGASANGLDVVNSLGVDDRIMLMARSLAPGWIQTVFNVKIEIYYALSTTL
ncbi:hypothetical protein D9619_010233 [Psilocybe cf. subviscida]|uniref:Uncharacterized protein n=1 Tax=Psilocybe cf. subviscida TaxID=2480587 RepID=A0A8H5ERX3_9AGAR|nr:hypothetical protein D9619_010233 [Psilocybe cf. subviscida]